MEREAYGRTWRCWIVGFGLEGALVIVVQDAGDIGRDVAALGR